MHRCVYESFTPRHTAPFCAGKPDVPPLFVWKDLPSNTDVVVTYESKYGDVSTVFVLPNGQALAVGWYGDNHGPAPPSVASSDYQTLRRQFPNATVRLPEL